MFSSFGHIKECELWLKSQMAGYQDCAVYWIHTFSTDVEFDSFISLTYWGRLTRIGVSKLTIKASDNGLSPGRRQAIIWTSAGISLIEHLGTDFSEILIKINTLSCKKTHLKKSSGKWRPFCLALNVLKVIKFGIATIPCARTWRSAYRGSLCVSYERTWTRRYVF